MKRVKTFMLISLLTASFYSSAGIPVAVDASPEWAVEMDRTTQTMV